MKSILNTVKKSANILAAATVVSLVIANPAFAGPAISNWSANVKPAIESISQGLVDIGIPLITVALMFIGYQIAFSSKTLKALVPVVIGCLIVGSAPLLAQSLLGK
jgi:type IV secretion system protein VirB2